MKWLVLAIFAAAFVSSLFWIDSRDRKLAPGHQTIFAAIAVTGWVVVLLLGYLAV